MDASSQSAAGQHSGRSKNANPFIYSRLRGYASQVDNHVIDAKSSIANAMACAYSQPLSSSSNQLPPIMGDPYQSLPGTGSPGDRGTVPPSSPGAGQDSPHGGALPPQVLQELGALRAEIAGMESVIGFMKANGEGSFTALGRKSTPLPTQQQLRQRAEHYIKALTDAPLVQATASMRRSASPMGAGLGGGGGEPVYVTRWMEDTTSRANTAPSAVSPRQEEGFERITRDLKGTRTWRPSPAPQPVGRGEAVVLEAALDEALPQGGLAAKYQPWSNASQSAAQAFLLSQDIARDFDALESVQREAARQVAGHCSERGRLLIKVAERYREFFSVLHNTVANLRAANTEVSHRLDDMTNKCSSQEAVMEVQKQQVVAEQHKAEQERELRVQLETKLEHVQQDAEALAAKLTAENQLLASEVEHYMERLEQAREEGEEALVSGTAELQSQLGGLEDEKDSLAQRIRFLERQNIRMREDLHKTTPVQDNATEIDPAFLAPIPSSGLESRSRDDMSGTMSTAQEVDTPVRTRKKTSRVFGGFNGMVTSNMQGRIRGAHWTMTCIAQIYVDKIVSDTVADRDGNPRPGICEFTYDWHLTRYGLRNLAESNLLDLIASIKHHARRLQRIRWFGVFTGLVESAEKMDTPQHLAFYLFVLQQLAFPSSITGLFTCDTASDDAPVLIKQQQAQEAVKAVFRYMNDPDGAATFLGRHVENQPPDPDLGVIGAVKADSLIRQLMSQYRNRIEKNVAHLKALFRAGDLDKDGLISYDEFVMLFKHANPDTTDRLMTKIYSEAVRMLPPGQYLIPQEVFIEVAHLYGLDRWRIDANGLTIAAIAPDTPAAVGAASALSRALSMRLRDQPGTAAAAVAAAGAAKRGPKVKPIGDVIAQSEQMLLKMLESTLSSLDPSLDDMMNQARDRIALQPSWTMSDPDLVKRLTSLHKHMSEARLGGPHGSPPDAAAAWLSFRMLYAALTAVLTRRSASRPSSRAPNSPGGRRSSAMLAGPGAWRAGSAIGSGMLVSGLTGGDGVMAASAVGALNLRNTLSPPRSPQVRGTSPMAAGLQPWGGSRPASRSPSHSRGTLRSPMGLDGGGAMPPPKKTSGGGAGTSGAMQHLQDWISQQQLEDLDEVEGNEARPGSGAFPSKREPEGGTGSFSPRSPSGMVLEQDPSFGGAALATDEEQTLQPPAANAGEGMLHAASLEVAAEDTLAEGAGW